MSYHSIREEVRLFIKEHSLPFRTNCPICGHKNTFSAALLDGYIFYNCFHVSCGIRGKLDYDISLNDIRSGDFSISSNLHRSKSTSTPTTGSPSLIFEIPDHWGSPLQNEKCLNFLKHWKLLDLYASRKVHIFYDPKLDRCVFLLLDKQGVCKGAVGRNLTYGNNPRWFVYSRINGHPFRVAMGELRSAILVEDAISACNASTIYNAIAILGTSISKATIQYLLEYSPLYIALDQDATSKAVALQKQLGPYIDTRIIPLNKDLKYFNNQELEELKRNVSKR